MKILRNIVRDMEQEKMGERQHMEGKRERERERQIHEENDHDKETNERIKKI